MNDARKDPSPRLDSWKAIAAYLDRDERTVQRWERELGLPIRRVPGGRGRSVFAYASDIDEWLQTAQTSGATAATADGAAVIHTPRPRMRIAPSWAAAAGLLLAGAALIAVWRVTSNPINAADLHLVATTDGVAAFGARGTRLWEFPFSPAYTTQLAEVMNDPTFVSAGSAPAAYVATAFRIRHADNVREGGTLFQLSLSGQPQQSFSFDDHVTFGGTTYGPPWVITDFAVNDAGGATSIAIAAHHAVWSASIVTVLTVLDGVMHRHGTFVHAGWVEQVQWLASNRLVISGYSNAHDGGMVALLDPTGRDGIDGQGPEPPGSRYFCESCPAAPPLRMAVMPRTELNLVTASRFNRARIQVTPRSILTRTIEVAPPGQDAVDALYEFTPSLDLVRASFGDHYWELHRSLELQGKLHETRAQSADRNGPRVIQTWTPAVGWRTVTIR